MINPDEDIILKCITAMMMVRRMHDHSLCELDEKFALPPICADILVFLSKNPNYNTATHIIENRHFTKSHVSTALKLLEREGYITRFYDGTNHKTIYLSLTHKAIQALKEIEPLHLKFLQVLTAGISQEDLNITEHVLKKMVENAAEFSSGQKNECLRLHQKS